MRIPTREEQARYTGVNAHDTQRFNVQERTPNMQLQVNADMFGGGQAKALAQGAQELQKGARQIAHWYRENELTKATDAFTKYKESLNDDLYGENGILTSKGESALDAPKRANDLLKKRAAEFSQQAGNSLGQDFFMQQASGFNQQLMPRATMHAETERKNWMFATHSAAQESSKNDAVKNYHNPEVFNQHMGAVAMHATLAAQIQGLPPEAIKLKRDEAVSSGYMQVGQSLLAAGDYGAVEGLIKSGVVDGVKAVKLQEQMTSKKKIDASYAYTLEQRREREALKKFDDTQTALLEDGQIDAARQNALNAPSGYKQDSLRLVQNYAEGKRVVNDDATEWEVRQQMANDPEGFIRDWDPIKQRRKLDNSTIDYFNKQYEVLSKGGKEAKSMHDSVVEDSRRLTEARVVMFGKSSFEKLNDEEKKREINFTRILQERVDMEAIDKKRKLSGTEKKRISDEMLVEHGKESKWFTRDKVTYAFESAIPESEVVRIRQELKDNGYPDTEMNIRKAYEHQQKGKK